MRFRRGDERARREPFERHASRSVFGKPVLQPIDETYRIDERPVRVSIVVEDVRPHRRCEAEIGKLPPGIVWSDRTGGERHERDERDEDQPGTRRR